MSTIKLSWRIDKMQHITLTMLLMSATEPTFQADRSRLKATAYSNYKSYIDEKECVRAEPLKRAAVLTKRQNTTRTMPLMSVAESTFKSDRS